MPHLWLDAANFLNPINSPRHAILAQTSSIYDSRRTFITGYAKNKIADNAGLGPFSTNGPLLQTALAAKRTKGGKRSFAAFAKPPNACAKQTFNRVTSAWKLTLSVTNAVVPHLNIRPLTSLSCEMSSFAESTYFFKSAMGSQ